VPSAKVDGISFRAPDGEVAAMPGDIGRVVRRIEFDHALANVAKARGIDVRDGTGANDVRVEGLDAARVVTAHGEIEARVVVGADGVGSVVRKAMGIGAGTLRAQVLEIDTESVAGDRDRRLLHFDASDRRLLGYTWDFPTVVDGEKLVCRGIYRLMVTRLGDDAKEKASAKIEALFAERLHAMGLDLDRYKNKRFAERGFDPAERVAQGPLMLVGEAAGIDPVTGEGIAQAIEYGALAGSFLARVLRREADVADWAKLFGASRLARDLRIRQRVVRHFYGASRPAVERFVLESEDFLYVGCQHFAAQPYDMMKLAGVVVRLAARYAGLKISRALGADW
jgi:flavin-dependent dehydrogenase